MASLELWLVCHGETPWSREGRAQGQSDPPLSELGVRQAELLGRRLTGVSFDEVYTSDLARARYTARLALPAAEIKLDARLREMHFGVWEGKIWSSLEDDDRRALERWRQDPYRCRAPGGESYEDLLERVSAWLAELPPSGRVIAFTHGGTVRCALYRFTGLPQGASWRFQIDTGSVTRLVIGAGGAVVSAVNDTAHLR
jgi:broad specificity phosphatase PhoE